VAELNLTLEALQANEGDCLLLHYGPASQETRILIDGGAAGVYKNVLKPRLEQLRGGGRLDLRMVMVSHIDADHITGIENLLRGLVDEEENGKDLPYRIETLWHNSFEKLTEGRQASMESAAVASSLDGAFVPGLSYEAAAVVASVRLGIAVRNHAAKLAISINSGAGEALIRAPHECVRTIRIVPGLTFTILSPHDDELNQLDASWRKSKTRAKTGAAQAADYLNRTVPNISSIVVLAEASTGGEKKKRLLLTGDAGGDRIQRALERAKLLNQGKLHVDVLKLQHHGSNHSADLEFFRNITADHYVISGNGKHGNPHPETLGWLAEARQGEGCDVYLTNRQAVPGLTTSKIRYHFREDQALSIAVTLH